MSDKELKTVGLAKSFDDHGVHTQVILPLDQHFIAPQSYAITGASGTGKSTLLYMLGGLMKPTKGAVYVDGHNIAQFSATERANYLHHSIGFLFQLPYLIKELTVLENVMLKGLIADESYEQAKKRALQLLDIAGLADKAESRPPLLSGGQQQRVALMRALFGKPAFLLADEPTGNLDEATGERMVDLMLSCQKEWGMGLIVSTHDKQVADRMQRCFVLKDGALISCA